MSSKAAAMRKGKYCHYCNCELKEPRLRLPESRTAEHIVPRSLGGRMDRINIVPACKRCNEKRGDGISPCSCQKCTRAWLYHSLNLRLQKNRTDWPVAHQPKD